MNIEIVKSSDHYRADCKDLPGSPPCGIGVTKELAMAHLLWNVLFADDGRWKRYVDKDEPIIVNNKKWSWPKSYSR